MNRTYVPFVPLDVLEWQKQMIKEAREFVPGPNPDGSYRASPFMTYAPPGVYCSRFLEEAVTLPSLPAVLEFG